MEPQVPKSITMVTVTYITTESVVSIIWEVANTMILLHTLKKWFTHFTKSLFLQTTGSKTLAQ